MSVATAEQVGVTAEAPVTRIRLAELLGALSYALDLTEGQPEGHCLRACLIGSRLGRMIGLSTQLRWDLYYVLLLKDLGCSSNAARVCQLYLTDDRALKRDWKATGTGLREALGFVLRRTGRDAPLGKRAGAVLNILRRSGSIMQELTQTRCTRGADIARRLRFSEEVAGGIYALDEHWDGSGAPDGLAGEAIPLVARIALLAQVVDVFHGAAGPEAALAEVERRSGSWLDPALVTAFRTLAANPLFWGELTAPDLEARVFALEPAHAEVLLDEAYLDDVAEAFGEVVDAKSPFTGGHSARVAGFAAAISVEIGFDPARRRWLRRGALLHDIGKLGVSNTILDKPGSLDDPEWEAMRHHAADTQAILGRISAFHDLAPIAAAHHERLDGAGYPLRLGGDSISLATRIITACDIWDALTADRPYRGALPSSEALAIMERMTGSAIDPRCMAAIRTLA